MSKRNKRIFGIIGILSMVLAMGCSGAAGKMPESQTTTTTVDYEFYNRGQTSQEEIEAIIGSVVGGYIIAEAEYPQSTLVNYIYRGKCIYFPLCSVGYADLIKLLQEKPKVFFGVDKYTALYWWSANIVGTAQIISDKNEVAKWFKDYNKTLGQTGFNYPPEKEIPNAVFVKVTPDFISGRKMPDPQNQNFARAIPWIGLSHNRANLDIPAKLRPVATTGSTLAKEVVVSGVSLDVVESVLSGVRYCRFNMHNTDAPYSVTMSVLNFRDGKVFLHSSNKGQKMDCLRRNQNTSLDYQWFWNNSKWIAIHLEGKINIIDQPSALAKALGREGLAPERLAEMAKRVAILEFVPKKISGYQIDIPVDWYPMMTGTRTE